MRDTPYDMIDLDELPDPADLEAEELVQMENLEAEPEIPDVSWAEDIQKIESQILQEKAIQEAERIVDQEKELIAKHEAGEISDLTAELEAIHTIRPQKVRASRKAGLASVGITGDHLGDIGEQHLLITTGDPDILDEKDRVRNKVRRDGADYSQGLADQMKDEEKLGEEAHEMVSRQARLRHLEE